MPSCTRMYWIVSVADTFLISNRFQKVVFGTSGVRALVSDLNAQAVFAYVFAFMQRMRERQMLAADVTVAVGMDLRPSSPGIAATVCGALRAQGFKAEFLGTVPTPALALRCLRAVCRA